MQAETDFLNDALGQAGITRIINIQDPNERAVWCKTFYPQLRKAMLRATFWNFAEARAVLALDSTNPPPFEYSAAFTLPSELIRIKTYNGANVIPLASSPTYWMHVEGVYKIEGLRLLTNDNQAFIIYTQDIDNPALFDPIFYQMLSTLLASKLAAAILKDPRKSESLLEKSMAIWLPFAAGVNGQENPILPYMSDSLLRGRSLG